MMSEQVVQDPVESDQKRPSTHGMHDRGLLLIGLFKLLKSAFFFCVGIGALHLMNKDLGDEAMKVAKIFRFDVEGRFVALLVEKVDLIDQHRLREIGFGVFAYSALALVEGTGLMLEKAWAEYLTLGLTVLFLPWEVFELIRGPGWGRLGLLIFNLLILVYLLWLLRRKKLAGTSPSPVSS